MAKFIVFTDAKGAENRVSPNLASGLTIDEIAALVVPVGLPYSIVDNVPPPPPTAEEQEALRKAAYIAESDPLFFKYQRDEATKEEWLAKIEEIKARYPDPVE
jgi:hypothetical protein